MSEPIDALSAEQAQDALLRFYQLLPKEMWSDGKPDVAELQGLAEDISEGTPDDVRDQVDSLLGPGEAGDRGTLAKAVLGQLEAIEPFRPYVDQAVTEAAQSRMIAETVVAGSVLVVIAVLPRVTRDADGKWSIHFDPAGNMKNLIDSLTSFVREWKGGHSA